MKILESKCLDFFDFQLEGGIIQQGHSIYRGIERLNGLNN